MIPKALQEKIESAMLDVQTSNTHAFQEGAEALYALLMEDAVEFNKDLAIETAWKESDPLSPISSFFDGAKFQHSQSSAVISALKAEIERLKERIEGLEFDREHSKGGF